MLSIYKTLGTPGLQLTQPPTPKSGLVTMRRSYLGVYGVKLVYI